MRYLNASRISPIDTWLKIALACEKENVASLKVLEERLKEAYGEYAEIIENNKQKIPVTKFGNEQALLVNYYSGAPAELARAMKLRRADDSIQECPYCGYPLVPDTLDHFIPKDDWPEYSFYPDNLVPQCRGCAPTKGKQYFCSINNAAKFIHPFFSDLLSRVSFKIAVTYNEHKPIFGVTFKSIGPVTNEEKARIKLHVESLKLKTRIPIYCRRTFNRWLHLTRQTGCDVALAFRQRLQELGGPGIHSQNWAHAFYEAMLSNDEVMKYFTAQRGTVSVPQQTAVDLDI